METPPDRRARRQLDEAAATGFFERTSGRGKPLTMTSDETHVPGDLRLAFKVMHDANVSPPWIALAREVEQALDELRREVDRHEHRMRTLRDAAVAGRPADFKETFKNASAVHRRQRLEFGRLLDRAQRNVEKLAATAPDGAPRVMFRPSTFRRRFDAIWPWPEHSEDEPSA